MGDRERGRDRQRGARGDLAALLGLDLPDDARLAVTRARAYDCAAMELFAGLFASRRSYDIIRGLDSHGQWRCGVLEQSWRIGGASGAEIAALRAFRNEPALHAVRASCVELHGESDAPPAHAAMHFCGIDEEVGLITKYSLVEPHVHAR
jgi:hypothetical protein